MSNITVQVVNWSNSSTKANKIFTVESQMTHRESNPVQEEWPLLYWRTIEEIYAYRNKSVPLKLQWLEAQMEFFHKVMPEKAIKVRERFRRGEI